MVTATIPLSLGQQLDDIGRRLDAATTRWAAAGRPFDGPIADEREDVYEDLRAWSMRVAVNVRY